MGFDTLAMRESFYMSNISPQVRPFNNGIWRELEEQTRDWAREYGRLYVVTGPVLHEHLSIRIGKNRVTVPDLFYKVLVDPDEPEVKTIAFIIPNALSDKPLTHFAVPIDSVESLTGIDFFPLLDGRITEDSIDPSLWKINSKRFQKRVNEWNFK
jgi:endonuclease G